MVSDTSVASIVDALCADARKIHPMDHSTPATDPTPRWRRIEQDLPEIHLALQYAAEAIYEQAEESVEVDGTAPDLSAAKGFGYLVRESERISFTDLNVRQEYLSQHMATVMASEWNEPNQFDEALVEAQRRTLEYFPQREATTLILLILAYDHDRDIIGRLGELARATADGNPQNRLFWDLYNPFCEALPELEFEINDLARTLEAVSEATANDGTAGILHNAVEELASRSRAKGNKLYETFKAYPDSRLITFLPAILVGFAAFDLHEAHRRAIELAESDVPAVRRAAIAALGHISYSEDDHGCLLDATWNRLEQIRSAPDPEVDYALARAYGNILSRKPEATKALIELSKRPEPATRGHVSSILFQKADEAHGEAWFKEALLNLAVTPASQVGTWKNLDHSMYRVSRENPNLAVEFMEAMVISRRYGSDDEEGKLPEMLHGAFAELVRHHSETLKETVTRWFSSSERRLHRAARDVVHATYDITSGAQPWLTLSKPVLDELDEQDTVYTLRRIVGYVVTSRPLAALLLSATRRNSCSHELLSFIAGALTDYALYNYPHEAGDHLRSRLENSDVSEEETKVAQAALGSSESYLKALNDLPQLREFQPPSHRRYLLRLAEHKQQTEIMDRAKHSSVLLSIMPELPLKYGRSHFMEIEGGFTEPSKLSPFSVSAEKPRGEILDPVGQMYRRLREQSAGLNEGSTSGDEDANNAGDAAGGGGA